MKLYLNFLFILFCTIFSAQNKESNSLNKEKTIAKTSVLNINREKYQSKFSDSILVTESKKDNLISEKNVKTLDSKKAFSEIKTDQEKSTAEQNISIEQEINAVLNYKVNRVWRRDLYCFACENYDSGKVA